MQIFPFFLAAAGCPHGCIYCRQDVATVPSQLTPDAVAATLERLLPAAGTGEVAFYGGSFTLLPDALQRDLLSAVAPYIASGRVAGIRISTRPDALSPSRLDQLTAGGVNTVEVGAQSFSPEVLRRSGRGYLPAAIADGVVRLRQRGFAVGLQLMPFLPGGDRSEARASLTEALRLRPDFLRIYPTVVLDGTPLAELVAGGDYQPATLPLAVDCAAEMLWLCRRARCPVIRIGLQGTPALEGAGGVVAGPYHPAFGQLVRARLWMRAFESLQDAGGVAFRVAPADLSDALGHRRENLVQLLRRWPQTSIRPDPGLERETFASGSSLHSLAVLNLYPE